MDEMDMDGLDSDFDVAIDNDADPESFESLESLDEVTDSNEAVDSDALDTLEEVLDAPTDSGLVPIEILEDVELPEDWSDTAEPSYEALDLDEDMDEGVDEETSTAILETLEYPDESQDINTQLSEQVDELEEVEQHEEEVALDEDATERAALREQLLELRERAMSLAEMQNADEGTDEDAPMVLTREITDEVIESRAKDTEETLDSYRENLRAYGVDEERIEAFVNEERSKIEAEYESLDRGDKNPQMYEMPNDWEDIATALIEGAEPELQEDMEEAYDLENIESVYEERSQEELEQGFEDIDINADAERLDASLEDFTESNWEALSDDERKESMAELADYVVDVIGFENPPEIKYYYNDQVGDYGGYNAATNTLSINEYMLYDSDEAADTIAHELWHAHQHERSVNPQNERDLEYQYNFNNYIPPELGQEAYEAQLVEAEARAFAAQFKDRLSVMRGRQR